MNIRKLSTALSHTDIRELEQAKHHAGVIGFPLNTHIAFAPYADANDIPSPVETAATFRRFLKHLAVWVRRHTGHPFTYLSVVHTSDDGSGRNPHLHVFMHMPTGQHRAQLQAALNKVYGDADRGRLVAAVLLGSDELVKHPSGYAGSTFDYITRHKTQQAFVMQRGRSWRASERDATGRHRGIKTPFVGKRWATSRNINRRARDAYDDAQRRAVLSAKQQQRVA